MIIRTTTRSERKHGAGEPRGYWCGGWHPDDPEKLWYVLVPFNLAAIAYLWTVRAFAVTARAVVTVWRVTADEWANSDGPMPRRDHDE